jgi:hypothetical protein
LDFKGFGASRRQTDFPKRPPDPIAQKITAGVKVAVFEKQCNHLFISILATDNLLL